MYLAAVDRDETEGVKVDLEDYLRKKKKKALSLAWRGGYGAYSKSTKTLMLLIGAQLKDREENQKHETK